MEDSRICQKHGALVKHLRTDGTVVYSCTECGYAENEEGEML